MQHIEPLARYLPADAPVQPVDHVQRLRHLNGIVDEVSGHSMLDDVRECANATLTVASDPVNPTAIRIQARRDLLLEATLSTVRRMEVQVRARLSGCNGQSVLTGPHGRSNTTSINAFNPEPWLADAPTSLFSFPDVGRELIGRALRKSFLQVFEEGRYTGAQQPSRRIECP